MNIGQFIQTLIGTIIGGCLVIVANWISAQRTRRESIQDWYRNKYITEGIDPLITFFVNLEFRWKWSDQKLLSLDDLPIAALANLQILLDSDILTWIARDIQNELTNKQINIETQLILEDIRPILLDLRKGLLKNIPIQVKGRNYQLSLPGFQQRFEKKYNELQSQIGRNKNKSM